MLTVVITIAFFIAAALLLAVGALLKKRTPLKGTCGVGAGHSDEDIESHVCEVCSCDKLSGH